MERMFNVFSQLTIHSHIYYADVRNAETIQDFWKTWNIPVHKWALR